MGRAYVDEDGKTFPKYKENPFLQHTAEISTVGWKPQYANPDGGIAVLSEATGKITGAAVVFRKEVEQSEFIKVYAEGIGAILNLKVAGKKVFTLIYRQLFGKDGIGKTRVILDWNSLPDEDQKRISRPTLNRGIKQCLENEIIARTMIPGLFFINPAFIFNGNRLNIVRQFIIKDQNKKTQNQKTIEPENEIYLPDPDEKQE